MSNPFDVNTVRCAGQGCEHVRQEANHWFVVSVTPLFGHCKTTFLCFPFAGSGKLNSWERPVCGQACAQKLFEEWLGRKES